jgi:RNA polymerase sigma-70 factor (ECF subfamily)
VPKNNKYQNNELLMNRIKDSDQAAFAQLFENLWKPLYVRAYTIVRDTQLAEDIVQEVWVDFWNRRETIANDSIESFLFQAVRFKAYNEYRNSSNRTRILEGLWSTYQKNSSDNVTETIHLSETQELLDDAISELPEKCRNVFVLSRYEGLSHLEIAQRLGISNKTVENHISKALRVLRSKVALFFVVSFVLILQ